MRLAHCMPLTPQLLAFLVEQRDTSGNRRHLLTARVKPERPMCENTTNLAWRLMDFDSKTMTALGFSAMAGTLLNEHGYRNPDAIKRQPGHAESDDVRRAHARGQHWTSGSR